MTIFKLFGKKNNKKQPAQPVYGGQNMHPYPSSGGFQHDGPVQGHDEPRLFGYPPTPGYGSQPQQQQPQSGFYPQQPPAGVGYPPPYQGPAPHPIQPQAPSGQPSSFSQEPGFAFNRGNAAPAFNPQVSSDSYQDYPQFSNNQAANFTSSNSSAPDLRDLRFWDQAPVDQGHNPYGQEEEESEHQPLRFVLALGILIVFAALAWVVFRWSTQTVTTVPPHIQADQNPFKVKPDHPGGIVVPHQDKSVYSRLGDEGNIQQQQHVERLLPPPEQPIYPGMDQQQGQQQGQPYPQGQQAAPYYPQNNNGAYYPPQGQQPYQDQQQGPMQQGGYPQQNMNPYPPQQGQGQQGQGQGGYPQQQYPMAQGQMGPQGMNAPFPSQDFAGQTYADNAPGEGDEVNENAYYPGNISQQKPMGDEKTKPTMTPPSKMDGKQVPQKQGVAPQAGTLGSVPSSALPPQHTQNTVTPQFYKAKIATLKTKKGAEQEWERLKKLHKDVFGGLNKFVQEQTLDDGEKHYVLYALGLHGEDKAKSFCKTLGNHCSFKKQQ